MVRTILQVQEKQGKYFVTREQKEATENFVKTFGEVMERCKAYKNCCRIVEVTIKNNDVPKRVCIYEEYVKSGFLN